MRTLLILLCILTASFSKAQEKPAANDDIQKLIKAIGVPQRINAMREYQRMWTSPEKEKEFMVQFEETVPIFLKNVEEYYSKAYTPEEIKELLKFYDSPLGRKITANADSLNGSYSVAEEQWSEMFNEIYFKYRESRPKAVTP